MSFFRFIDSHHTANFNFVIALQNTIQPGGYIAQSHEQSSLCLVAVMVHLSRLMSEHRHLLKSASLISALTIVSRTFGYIRDSRIAFLLGAGTAADAYTTAYRIPNLLRRLVGEGAVSAAFIPVFTRYIAEGKEEEGWEFANTMLTAITILLTAVTIAGILLSPQIVRLFASGFGATPGKLELTAALNRIMFPYIFLISLSALSMGVLNSFHRFGAPAFAPVVLNLTMIAFSFLGGLFGDVTRTLAVGVVAGGILQLAIQIPALMKSGWKIRFNIDFNHPGVRRVAKLIVPVIFGVGIVQINVLVDTQFASYLAEGSVTAIHIADRVMELVLGVYAVAISTVILPLLSRQAALRQMDRAEDDFEFRDQAHPFHYNSRNRRTGSAAARNHRGFVSAR